MKKICALLLAVMLLASLAVVPVSAEETTVNRRCDYCANEVDWTPWDADDASVSDVATGHYYLTEDMPKSTQKIIKGRVCLDLNGFTLSATGRALLSSGAQYSAGPVLNIYDSSSNGTGKVVSTGGSNNASGGTVTASSSGSSVGVVNLYSGTLQYVTTNKSITTLGGVVGVSGGIFNMYGGCVDATQCVLTDDSAEKVTIDGCGAAIAAYSGGKVNLAGGQVIAGKANAVGYGDCVYIHNANSPVVLEGDAQVEEVYFAASSEENFSISGAYTGAATLAFGSAVELSEGLKIGNLIYNGSITSAELRCEAEGYFVDVSGTDLLLTYANPNAEASVIVGSTVSNYDTWEEAFEKANGGCIRLNKSITENVNIKKDTYLDLNGCSITGALDIDKDITLYCMDSETDDFTVRDDKGYGKLTNVTGLGTICGLSLDEQITENAYFMIEKEGEYSFHCIDLQLKAMTLRPESAGVYYKSVFGADEMVKDYVSAYGVALSIIAEPTAENLESLCKRTVFTDFQAGGHDLDTTSTLLTNVMMESNPDLRNTQNAKTPVYGRAYILLKNGTYLFGNPAKRTLQEQVESVSDIWDGLTTAQKDSVYTMYTTYQNVMKSWDIINIEAFKNPEKDDVLKILNISNSHGQDAIWLLPSVLKAERPNQKFVIVELYRGFALTEHIEAAKENAAGYYYQINTGDGWTTVSTEMTIKDALKAHNWDIVSFNESSRHLGLESKMSQGMADWFLNYILENMDYVPQMQYDMTWASPTDENFYTDDTRQPATATFKNIYTQDYGFDHVNHYNQLVAMTKKYLVNHQGFDEIIYNATPVQYAGEVLKVPQYDEDQIYDLYRDYTHLSDYARLIVAYNWYCQIFDVEKLDAVNVDMIEWENRAPWNDRHKKLGDLTLTPEHKSVLIESVNHSLQYPLSITAE